MPQPLPPPLNELRFTFVPDSVRVSSEDERIIEGIASTEELDEYRSIVTREAVEAALPEYMASGAPLWDMHDHPAGQVLEAEYRENGLWIKARIDLDDTWALVKSGVYHGLSLSWRTLAWIEHWDIENEDERFWKITRMRIREISTVDRGATPGTGVDSFRSWLGTVPRSLSNLFSRVLGLTQTQNEEDEVNEKQARTLFGEMLEERDAKLEKRLARLEASRAGDSGNKPVEPTKGEERNSGGEAPSDETRAAIATLQEIGEKNAEAIRSLTATVKELAGEPIESRSAKGQDSNGDDDTWGGIL